MEKQNVENLELSKSVSDAANGTTQDVNSSVDAGGNLGAAAAQTGDVAKPSQEFVIDRTPRVVTAEILTAAQIVCGMTQEQIDARIAQVFDRLEAV